MLRMSKLTDYGIVVLSHMAGDPRRLYNAAQIAADVRIGPPTVSKILKRLSRGGLVVSYRGASGGYRLARSPAEISVTEVIGAMEGPVGITECSSAGGSCSQEPVCSVRPNWQRINDVIMNALRDVTLEDMTGGAPPGPTVLQWFAPDRIGSTESAS